MKPIKHLVICLLVPFAPPSLEVRARSLQAHPASSALLSSWLQAGQARRWLQTRCQQLAVDREVARAQGGLRRDFLVQGNEEVGVVSGCLARRICVLGTVGLFLQQGLMMFCER